VHGGRKLVKREGLLFLFSQASHRLWRALQHPPMGLQRTLSQGLKLLCECLVEATDGTGTGSDS
jgi:hypothetical protein